MTECPHRFLIATYDDQPDEEFKLFFPQVVMALGSCDEVRSYLINTPGYHVIATEELTA